MAQKKGQQQKKKQTEKARKLDHVAYAARERYPERVLRNIIQASGWDAAKVYAEKYGLTGHLTGLQLDGAGMVERQSRLVGRALRRHMKRLSLLAQAKKKTQAQQPQAAPIQSQPQFPTQQ